MIDDEILEQYRNEMKEKTKRIIAQNNYEFYKNHLGNDSVEALTLLEKIKDGYNPTQKDVFIIMCEDKNMIVEYTRFYDIRERVSKGFISEEDFDYLIRRMEIGNQNLEQSLKNDFIKKGILVKEYPKEDKEKGLN